MLLPFSRVGLKIFAGSTKELSTDTAIAQLYLRSFAGKAKADVLFYRLFAGRTKDFRGLT
jgi:hypothetical protein